MYAITTWARAHRWTARTIIVFIIYPLLNLCGWFLGDLMAYNGFVIDQSWCYYLSGFFLLLFLVYPYRLDRKYRNYFLWKRSVDALMILSTFCFIIVRGNGFIAGTAENGMITSSYAASTGVKSANSSLVVEKEKNPVKKIIKTLRKKFREADKNKKAGYIVLAILGAILLLIALLLLTCSIACSGAEALAYTVFLLGLVGIIILLARVLRRIKLGPKKKNTVPSPTS